MPDQNLVKVSSKDLKAKKANAASNRSDFIRQHPNLTANEVVELGKKNGLIFSRNLVYLVRGPRGDAAPKASTPKRGPGRPKKSNLVVTVKPGPKAEPTASSSDVEQLARLMLSVGLDRAEGLLKKLRAAIG